MAVPRVLQVVPSLNPGGTERLVVEIVNRLNPEIPMMVCCLDEAGRWAAEVEALGVEVTQLGRTPGFKPKLGREIALAIDRHRATVIHAHHYSPFVYSSLARLWRPGGRVLYTEHGRLSDAPASAKRRAANSVLKHLPRCVFAVSEDLKRHMVEEGFGQHAVEVIYNGIDVGPLPDMQERGRARRLLSAPDEDTFVIGTVARLDPVKDLATVIRAVARLASRVPLLVAIIGAGPERQSLTELVREFGVGELIRFFGYREDARQCLPGCDLYVNSSTSEGVSLTILEAMAASLPVVATRVGGTPEVIDDSCGRLVPARDPGALAAAIDELAGQPELRAALGRAGRHRVETRFTLDRMVSEYRDVYNEVA